MKTSATLAFALAAGAYAQAQTSSAGALGPSGDLFPQTTFPVATPAPGTRTVTSGVAGTPSPDGSPSTRTTVLTDANGRTTGSPTTSSQGEEMTGGPGGDASLQPDAGASIGVAVQWVVGAAGLAGMMAL